MNKYVRLLTTAMVAAAMVVMSAASAFAMGNGTGEIDYEKGVVRAVGMGVMPPQAVNLAQGKILARRAAIVDGWRQLAETVKGVQIDSDTTVEMNMTTSDVVKAHMSATIKGARVVSESFDKDGGADVRRDFVYRESRSAAADGKGAVPAARCFGSSGTSSLDVG